VNEAPVAAIDEGGGTTGPASLHPGEASAGTAVPGSAAKPAMMLSTTITSRFIQTPPAGDTPALNAIDWLGPLTSPLASRPPANKERHPTPGYYTTLGTTNGTINLDAATLNVGGGPACYQVDRLPETVSG
jgi:hypothetical protein